jgi:glycosyltransferase involved in cell wall biosynthesis
MVAGSVKADLHLHSRFSERAPEWLFRRAGLPDSYSQPADLYDQLRAAGHDFVTLTDHNSIDGCLTIAERTGVFISEQIATQFPEDRCAVELLVWGLDERQHRETIGLRDNIYELQGYLAQQGLAHAVAHPLHVLDGRMTLAHFEKLILLFSHFEGLNGLRDQLLSDVLRFILAALTPAKIDEMANRHSIAPTHAEPWRKIFTGGSDDHGGMFPGSAYTTTPAAATAGEFLEHVRAGRCEPGGTGGTPLIFSHGMYNNLRQFIASRFSEAESSTLVGKAFSRFMEGRDPTEFTWGEKIGFVAQGIATGSIFELAKPANASLWKQLSATFSADELKETIARQVADVTEPERRAFTMANLFANQLAFRFFKSFLHQISSGNIIEAIREISVLIPILATLTPYLYAFKSQAPDRARLRHFCRELTGGLPPPLRNGKRAWFTDTLEDVNGVTTTIRRLTAACVAEGYDLTVVTSVAHVNITDVPIKNFEPIGDFELPEYELQKLAFPPVLQMLDYIQREGFTELIISTPGPVGLTALLAGKVFGLRTSGIYHTDFPQYVRILSEDASMETLTWNFMSWFYGALDLVYVNSVGYQRAWEERGIPAERLRILPRGLDTALFHPSRREPTFWTSRGVPAGKKVLLYVGRVSKEKDLDIITAAWPRLAGNGTALAFVGDGPYLKELRHALPDAVFTGYLSGLDLARAFASSDLFVFPSTTDTFGNVVIEALACGLPCIVSDQGGPKDLIEAGVTGYITPALDPEAFAAQITGALADPARHAAMRTAARQAVESRDWREAARRFWAISEDGSGRSNQSDSDQS